MSNFTAYYLWRRLAVTGVFFFMSLCAAYSQQAPQFSLYHLQPALLNPAWAGYEESLSITGLHRQQWAELSGGPQTQMLIAHMPVYPLSSSILLQAERDLTGLLEVISFSGAWAYRIHLTSSVSLQAALGGGYLQAGIDGSRLRAPEGNYDEDIIDHNDPILPLVNVRGSEFSLHGGLVMVSSWVDAGVAVYHANRPSITWDGENSPIFTRAPYYTVFSRGRIPLSYPFELLPTLAIRTDITQIQTELTLNLNYLDNIQGGFSFRGYNKNTMDALAFHIALRIRGNAMVGYAYDIPLSAFGNVHRGSHEIMLKLNFEGPAGKGVPPKIIYNPRYF